MSDWKAVLFDWHGVLDRRTLAGLLDVIAMQYHSDADISGTSMEVTRREVTSVLWSDGVDYAAGRLQPNTFWTMLAKKYPAPIVDAAKAYFLRIEKNDKLWQSLPTLKRKVTLGILADCPKDKTQIIKATCDLKSLFECIYFTSDHGTIKEDPRCFRQAVDTLGLPAQRVLFVDDAERNLEYAREAGLQTHLYRKPAQFEALIETTVR